MPNKSKPKRKSVRRPRNPMPVIQQIVHQPQPYLQLVHPNGDFVRFTAAQLKLAPTSQFIQGADDHTTLVAHTDLVGTIVLAHFPGVLSTNQPAAKTQEKK